MSYLDGFVRGREAAQIMRERERGKPETKRLLGIVKDIANLSPIGGLDGRLLICRFCGVRLLRACSFKNLSYHRADCIWRRAKEEVKGIKEPNDE